MRHTPLLIGIACLVAAAQASAQTSFGRALVIGDGEVIVGEPANNNAFRPGRVYVYRKTAGVWREAARLTAPDTGRADGFGSALALSGSTLFVSKGDGATIHVFNKQAGVWKAAGTLTTPAGPIEGPLGAMAAIGDWLFVGLPGRALGGRGGGGGGGRGGQQANASAGAVIVFQRGEDKEWRQRVRLVAHEPAAGDGFGSAMALADGMALIGAPGAKERQGAVYSFAYHTELRSWMQGNVLQAREPQANEAFGSSLVLQNGVLIAGAPGAAANYGAAFVYRRNEQSGEWVEETRLAAFTGNRQERFGSAIAASGNDVLVAVPGRSERSGGAQRRPGGVYLFQSRAGGSVSAARLITPAKLDPDDQFGQPLAVRGAIAAVASPGADHNAGVVTIFERNAATGEWREHSRLASQPDALQSLTGRERKCSEEGKVGVFACGGAELSSFLPVSKIAIEPRGVRLNDMWGWTDPETGREYALVGRIDGTSFVDVTDPVNPNFLGDLPKTRGVASAARGATSRSTRTTRSSWPTARAQHGMQVFDLTQLRGRQERARSASSRPCTTRASPARTTS